MRGKTVGEGGALLIVTSVIRQRWLVAKVARLYPTIASTWYIIVCIQPGGWYTSMGYYFNEWPVPGISDT